MVAPATEPSQYLQPNVFKDASVKSVIKKIANINTPNAKHPQKCLQIFNHFLSELAHINYPYQ